MSDESRIHDLLSPMRERVVDLESRRFRVNRENVVERMMHVAPHAARSESRLWSAAALVAAAALCLVAWWTVRSENVGTVAEPAKSVERLSITAQQGTVTHSRAGKRAVVLPGRANDAAPEGELATGASARALLRTGNGVEIEVLENSRVVLSEMQPGKTELSLRLMTGTVRCRVPRLPDGQTFVVVTPDARVIDRGNIFSVGTSGQTVVHVERGQVLVQHREGETLVTQTASFQTKPAVSLEVLALETQGDSTQTPRTVSSPPRTRTPAKTVRGTLEEETRLLRSALAAERDGRPGDAKLALKTLLSRYPDSPLTPDARAALARVEGRLDSR